MADSRANEIFLVARDIDSPGERDAYLQETCGHNLELRGAVDTLLRAHVVDHFLDGQGDGQADQKRATQGFVAQPATEPGVAPISDGAGTILGGRYKLLQQIGEGGMGTVWMAEQTEPVKRLVALKLIKLGMDSSQVIARFESERQTLALMDHPNIAKVLDAGTTTADGANGDQIAATRLPTSVFSARPYFVMELVKGVPITKFCDERRLTPRERLELFIPVCQAVQHAHQKGIIHRDLKPSNVLIALYDGKPVPKIIDFGVAKATGQKLTERTMFTGFGAIVGTLEYMAPEQAELNQLDIDTRSDIYSLGVVLYELLTGSTPLERERLQEGSLLDVLRRIREEEPPRPSTRLSTSDTLPILSAQRQTEPARLKKLVRGELDWIVMKALEKDRNRRYDTAADFAQDIARFLNDEPVSAGPPSAGYRLRKFMKRHRGGVLASVVVLLSLIAGVVGTTLGLLRAIDAEQAALTSADLAKANEANAREQAFQASQARERAEQLAKQEIAARELAEKHERSAKFEALRAETARHTILIEQALRAWHADDMPEVEHILDRVADPFLQTWETRFVRNLSKRKLRTLALTNPHTLAPTLSADGRRIITSERVNTYDALNKVTVWDAGAGQEISHFFVNRRFHHTSLAASPDGQLIAAGDPDLQVKLWNADGREIGTLKNHKGVVLCLAISADGRTLAAGDSAGEVKVWDLLSMTSVATLRGHTQRVTCVAVSADGRRIVSGGNDGTARLWDTTIGREMHVIGKVAVDYPTSDVAIAPDGQWFVSASQTSQSFVRVWDAQTGRLKFNLLDTVSSQPYGVAVSGDGSRIFTNHTGGLKIWDAATGKELQTVKLGDATRHVAANFDGRRVVASSYKVRIWDEDTTPEAFTVPEKSSVARHLSFSSDGRRLAGLSGRLKVWDGATGQELFVVQDGAFQHVTISPDGQYLAFANFLTIAKERSVTLWDLAGGQKRHDFKMGQGSLAGLHFSRDGKKLLTAIGQRLPMTGESGREVSENTLRLWDVETGNEISGFRMQTQPALLKAILTADAWRIITTTSRSLQVWDAKTGDELVGRNDLDGVVGVAVSGDGRRIVTSNFQHVQVWDAQTLKLLLTLEDPSPVFHLAINEDGSRIFSANYERTIKLWDGVTGQEMLMLSIGEQRISGMALSADGKKLAVASEAAKTAGNENSVVRVWEAP